MYYYNIFNQMYLINFREITDGLTVDAVGAGDQRYTTSNESPKEFLDHKYQ